MRLLFVCNQGKHRSRTAAEIFSDSYETDFAGLYSSAPLTEAQLNRADIVVVMEDFQRTEIGKRFPKMYLQKQIVSFNVPDVFTHNDPELIELLEKRMKELLTPILQTEA